MNPGRAGLLLGPFPRLGALDDHCLYPSTRDLRLNERKGGNCQNWLLPYPQLCGPLPICFITAKPKSLRVQATKLTEPTCLINRSAHALGTERRRQGTPLHMLPRSCGKTSRAGRQENRRSEDCPALARVLPKPNLRERPRRHRH